MEIKLFQNLISTKKFRKIKKSLNIIAENDVIYVADNIGYLYAYNYVREKNSLGKEL